MLFTKFIFLKKWLGLAGNEENTGTDGLRDHQVLDLNISHPNNATGMLCSYYWIKAALTLQENLHTFKSQNPDNMCAYKR